MAEDTVQIEYSAMATISSQLNQLHETQVNLESAIRSAYEPLHGGDWEGKGAGAFFQVMEGSIFPSLKRLQQALTVANQISTSVVQIFQNAEQEASQLFKGSDDFGASAGGGGSNGGRNTDNFAEGTTTSSTGGLDPAVAKRWAELTPDQQAAVLQSISNEICDKYGIKHVPVSVVDLPDPPGMDLRGQRSDAGLFIDIDNMNDPDVVLNTVAHEVRHEVQRQMGLQANPSAWDQMMRKMGLQPTPTWPNHDITEAQANIWHKNFDNYIPASRDFQGYLDQPVEVDARAFGENYRDNLTLDTFNKHVPAAKPTTPTGTTTPTTAPPRPAPTPAPATPAPRPGPAPTRE